MILKTENSQRNINETKSWVFKNINKMDKRLTRLTKIRKIQITNSKNEIGAISTDFMDNKRITKEYYEQFHAHKFDNPDEQEQFLEKHNLLKLTQEEKDNLYRPISINEIGSVIIFQN